MLKLSRRAFHMPESPIRKLMPFAEKAKAEGKKVFHLNIGQPDIKTPEVVMDRLRDLELKVIEYSSSEGFGSYREKLAEYYRSKDIPVNTEDIMITTGGSEALVFAMMTCFDPGDEVIIPEPYYANYSGFATMAGVNVRPITSHIEDEFAPPSVAEFEKLITEHTQGIVLCNPGNPTGAVYSREDIQAIADLAKRHNLYLIADEVYREFCYDGATPFSVMKLDGMDENVILIDSVSKRYSMCGVRIGAMITKNKTVRQNALKFAQARLSPPTLGQIAAEAALETPQSYFDGVLGEYQKRRDILVSGMNAIPGVTCPKPGGAFYCIAKLPVEDSEDFCKWLLSTYSLNGETVMLAPGSGFYITEGLGKQEVRIAYVLNEADLKKSIKIIEEALVVYAAKAEV
ncbi:MAG TPA: pyridoxal phosphate-dependent aminotransferase [Cryomorphaceae bacterium]|nr:pyridoxal phosphate-dependent aminotransferase [Cryomorphaceae bacterium]